LAFEDVIFHLGDSVMSGFLYLDPSGGRARPGPDDLRRNAANGRWGGRRSANVTSAGASLRAPGAAALGRERE
jgi:hypothetical protein